MLNEATKQILFNSLTRFQSAIAFHDHPNLALQDHLHPEYDKAEETTSVLIVAGVATIDLSKGSFFTIDVTEDITNLNIVNMVGSGKRVDIKFIQDSVGLFSVTAWPGGFKWVGAAPDITQTNNAINSLSLVTYGSGDWIAQLSGPYV